MTLQTFPASAGAPERRGYSATIDTGLRKVDKGFILPVRIHDARQPTTVQVTWMLPTADVRAEVWAFYQANRDRRFYVVGLTLPGTSGPHVAAFVGRPAWKPIGDAAGEFSAELEVQEVGGADSAPIGYRIALSGSPGIVRLSGDLQSGTDGVQLSGDAGEPAFISLSGDTSGAILLSGDTQGGGDRLKASGG